ncbi:hypothetical protein QYF36_004360 [Acer negundo]|nr:hypothetical protein QYF36_004360 [Acer negundo]
MKVFFFLVGFYCATAFATVIGQTGDWDILSAALAVVVVEGVGALILCIWFELSKMECDGDVGEVEGEEANVCGQWISMVCLLQSVIPENKKSMTPNAQLTVFRAESSAGV